jgi:hypothetical protein
MTSLQIADLFVGAIYLVSFGFGLWYQFKQLSKKIKK